jgi:thymidine kinase
MKLMVITGPMFAGKTTKLIEYYKSFNKKETLAFNHLFDNRYNSEKNIICSHNNKEISSYNFSNIDDIYNFINNKINNDNIKIKNIIIDECQFFENIDILVEKINLNFKFIETIICAGLNLDANKNIFNPNFQNLIDTCDELYTLTAKCYVCNNIAKYTSCLVDNNLINSNVLVGSDDKYQPTCEIHFT